VVDGPNVYVGLAAFRVADGTPVYPAKEWNLYNALSIGTVAGRRVLVHDGAGYDAADGTQLWSMKNCAGISTPVLHGDAFFIYGQEPDVPPAAPKHPRLYRIRVKDGRLAPELAWKQESVTGFLFHLTNFQTSSVAVSGGHAYAWFGSRAQRHGVACIDLSTGEVAWGVDGRKTGMAGECYSSPLIADGKLYAVDGAGVLYMMKADPRAFTLLAKAKVCDATYASPALSDGRLYLRDDRKLVCLKLR
jgi:outer membrane protein assembly factor BamB